MHFFSFHRYHRGGCQVKAWQSPGTSSQDKNGPRASSKRAKGQKQAGQGPIEPVENNTEPNKRKGAPAREQPQLLQPVGGDLWSGACEVDYKWDGELWDG